jgi:hypothetical protein
MKTCTKTKALSLSVFFYCFWNPWGKKGQKRQKGTFQSFLKSSNYIYLPQIKNIVAEVAEVSIVRF